jgi:hypothetical protein
MLTHFTCKYPIYQFIFDKDINNILIIQTKKGAGGLNPTEGSPGPQRSVIPVPNRSE